MADICHLQGHGRVVTIDWDRDDKRPVHPRITYLQGDTLSPETKEQALKLFGYEEKKLLVLDDGHSHEHVQQELELWFDILRPGDCLIVEDTDLGGPFWGLEAFQKNHPEAHLVPIPQAERFLLTTNPKGYWKVMGWSREILEITKT